ncbi:MAG: YicC family protein [Bacteriovoracaceae bacterium]|jgi:uncharacterized protein (TIGR00255 family)|nr:YicC family protein [Bacteriovoracaceae bacterium]
MAIQSMTGFGRGESENGNFSFTVDIKSVNHRFKDIRFKMSSIFTPLELEFKKILLHKFKRGSFDIFINYKKTVDKSNVVDLDTEKINDFLKKLKTISTSTDVEIVFSPTDFLRQEFYKDKNEKTETEMFVLAKEAFSNALNNLEESRAIEGEKLVEVLINHKKEYKKYYQLIVSKLPEFQHHVETKLKKRFDEFKPELGVDEPRFLQEVVYYLEKLDVSEETNRIQIHLEKLEKLLTEKQEVGRQIDFLMQELGRETNTIGSKSSISEISDSVVQMKVQLEKIREQGLNLE